MDYCIDCKYSSKIIDRFARVGTGIRWHRIIDGQHTVSVVTCRYASRFLAYVAPIESPVYERSRKTGSFARNDYGLAGMFFNSSLWSDNNSRFSFDFKNEKSVVKTYRHTNKCLRLLPHPISSLPSRQSVWSSHKNPFCRHILFNWFLIKLLSWEWINRFRHWLPFWTHWLPLLHRNSHELQTSPCFFDARSRKKKLSF